MSASPTQVTSWLGRICYFPCRRSCMLNWRPLLCHCKWLINYKAWLIFHGNHWQTSHLLQRVLDEVHPQLLFLRIWQKTCSERKPACKPKRERNVPPHTTLLSALKHPPSTINSVVYLFSYYFQEKYNSKEAACARQRKKITKYVYSTTNMQALIIR